MKKEIELENNDEFVSVISEAEIKLAEFKNDLDIPKIDFKKWNDIKFESDNQVAGIKRKITDLENELLSNKRFVYENNKNLDTENWNKAKILHENIKRKEKFVEFGSFQSLKRQFKYFSKDKGALFSSESYFFNGVNWYLTLKNNDEDKLCCRVHCSRQTKNTEVSAKINVSLFNTKNLDKNKIQKLEYKCTEDGVTDYHKFISFDDIFNQGFYDEKNDSIHLSVLIHVLEICE